MKETGNRNNFLLVAYQVFFTCSNVKSAKTLNILLKYQIIYDMHRVIRMHSPNDRFFPAILHDSFHVGTIIFLSNGKHALKNSVVFFIFHDITGKHGIWTVSVMTTAELIVKIQKGPSLDSERVRYGYPP